jgi:hypothetical protein
MKRLLFISTLFFVTQNILAQQSHEITFMHEGKIVFGTFTIPEGSGTFPTIIINPGSGANDRDGTLPMVGPNIECLYPGLLNSTLRPYKELGDALVAAGFAVLRYDKLEFTYPTTLGTITFEKLWLPVESAIAYVKTRTDVDTSRIILIGHSEGSSLIPFIAKDRSDIKALISIAGARTPFDSILAYQIVNITRTCNGDTMVAKIQANQILAYFAAIRSNTWNSNTPPLFGVPASEWYEYVLATDPVALHYNQNNLPTLFIGLELDINVPPSELVRFQEEVTITNDFWSIPGLNHYMTPNDDPHISTTLTDTLIFWLTECLTTGTSDRHPDKTGLQVYPNPFRSTVSINSVHQEFLDVDLHVINAIGQHVFQLKGFDMSKEIDLSFLEKGIYFLKISRDGMYVTERIVKQ